MSCEDTWGRASGRGGGNSQCGGPKAGVCLACFENMFEEAGVAETSEGDSSRRGAWQGGGSVGPDHAGAAWNGRTLAPPLREMGI